MSSKGSFYSESAVEYTSTNTSLADEILAVANAETYAAEALTSETAAAASALAAASSATNSASSASAASTSATNAATSASGASTSATNAASSATNAASSATAASTSASGASTSATAAAASATAASSSASGASTSATNASYSASAALTSQTAAASSATAASSSASGASTSATNAASSATAASSSASGASTSATNAASSATAASTSASGASTSATAAAASAAAAAVSAGLAAGVYFDAAKRCGSFSIWQRGTSLAVPASTNSAYQNDGWYILTNANQASTVSRVTGVAAGSQYAANIARNSGQTGTSIMRYMAPLASDEITPLQGNYAALSFTVKAGANWSPASGTLSYSVFCGTGVPAKRQTTPYTGETNVFNSSVNLTTTATRVTVTSAAVWPTNGTQAEIQFYWTPFGTAGADDSFTIEGLKLEIVSSSSSTATAFSHSPTQQLLALAQRWLPAYASTGTTVGVGFGHAFSTTLMFASITLPVPTRVPVTGLSYSAVGHFGATDASGTPITSTALTFLNAHASCATLKCTVASGLVGGNGSGLFFTNASGLLLFTGAEI